MPSAPHDGINARHGEPARCVAARERAALGPPSLVAARRKDLKR
ncbi:hypothetical protein ACWGE0_15085 [Lentzea sp. NPDC054927]